MNENGSAPEPRDYVIQLANGSQLHVSSLDKPKRSESDWRSASLNWPDWASATDGCYATMPSFTSPSTACLSGMEPDPQFGEPTAAACVLCRVGENGLPWLLR